MCSGSFCMQPLWVEFIKEPTVDHYACLVGIFARAGRLNAAVDFVEKIFFEDNEHN